MIFRITHYPAVEDEMFPDAESWSWSLVRGIEANPGETIARGVESFDSERTARQSITAAKKAMGGVRFAKTVVVDAPEA